MPAFKVRDLLETVHLSCQKTCGETERQAQLWERPFAKPWEWHDNRVGGKSSSHPDFRHGVSNEPLWLNNPYKPKWVEEWLVGLENPSQERQQQQQNRTKVQRREAAQAHFGPLCEQGQLDKALHAAAGPFSNGRYVSSPNELMVLSLANCGALDDAFSVFVSLPCRPPFLWASLISAYTQYGRGQEALYLYQLLQSEGVAPDLYTFVSLFKACASIPDLVETQKLHVDASRNAFCSDVFVGSALVTAYGKCGGIAEAESVFIGLHHRNIVSWNAILSVYVEHNQAAKALLLYRQMKEEGHTPDKRSFVIVIQSCIMIDGFQVEKPSRLPSLEVGQALHADAQRCGFTSDVYVGSILLNMYGSCGCLTEAVNVFDEVSQHNVVTWTAMLNAYYQQAQEDISLLLYVQMQEEGVLVNQKTITVALQACAELVEKIAGVDRKLINVTYLEICHALHVDAQTQAFASDVFFGSALISLYGKCQSIGKAEHVFFGSHERDTVLWNTMLAAYMEGEEGGKALQLYRQMQEEGVRADRQTFVIILQAFGTLLEAGCGLEGESARASCLNIGKALYFDAFRAGFAHDAVFDRALLSIWCNFGCIAEADMLFDRSPRLDCVSWNKMLSMYLEQGQSYEALLLYRQLHEEGVSPDQQSLIIALQACGDLAQKERSMDFEHQATKLMALEIAKALHVDMDNKGLSLDITVANTLVNVYGKCGTIMEAENVFDGLLDPDVVSWNAILSTYIEQGHSEKVLQIYRQMVEECATLNEATIKYILQACIERGRVEICRELHFLVSAAGLENDFHLLTTFIRAYGSCASMLDAEVVFDALLQPDVVAWNACIAGHAQEGNCGGSLQLFDSMQQTGTTPDEATFLSLLYACDHSSLVQKGIECFESMRAVYAATPSLNHYVVILDILGRTGDFKKVEDILVGMPMQADLKVWLCLLAACRTHRNIKLGKQAFSYATEFDPSTATAAYVLMSNLSADAELKVLAEI